MKLLVEGWYRIPHSYAIVNCFQMYYLHKNFPTLEIFVEEPDYFLEKWSKNQNDLSWFPSDMRRFLQSLRAPHEKCDVIYRISFPYDISASPSKTLVFYTCELGRLTPEYFTPNLTEAQLYPILQSNFDYVCPSKWSRLGLENIVLPEKNHVISHGVDLSLFYRDESLRSIGRKKYRLDDNDLVFLHSGAMTQNKGIFETLVTLLHLVKRYNKTHFRLVLKCSTVLYETETCLKMYKEQMLQLYPELDVNAFFRDIVLITDLLSFSELNELYNTCDVYMSPYSGEGFNMVPLEALASGMHVVISDKGGAEDYTQAISPYTGCVLIPSYPSEWKQLKFNKVSVPELIDAILLLENQFTVPVATDEYLSMRSILENRYSWNHVAMELYDLLARITNGF
jgi:glycosyltransferase involved in cell wall biosynthesis